MNVTKLIVLLLFAVPLGAQQQTSSRPANSSETVTDKAFLAGWNDGWKAALKEYAPNFGDSPQKLKIEILVEEFQDSDSFRYAAAEVIRTQFAEHLQIEPRADLFLYIAGTNELGQAKVQSIKTSVRVLVQHSALAGKEHRMLTGAFELATSDTVLGGYADADRTRVVKEEVYKVLSKFLKQWDEAKPVAE